MPGFPSQPAGPLRPPEVGERGISGGNHSALPAAPPSYHTRVLNYSSPGQVDRTYASNKCPPYNKDNILGFGMRM